jgi:hypothetical protein
MRQTEEAKTIGADEVVVTDDDNAIANLPPLDAVADTVNGKTAEKLIANVKQGGVFASDKRPLKGWYRENLAGGVKSSDDPTAPGTQNCTPFDFASVPGSTQSGDAELSTLATGFDLSLASSRQTVPCPKES